MVWRGSKEESGWYDSEAEFLEEARRSPEDIAEDIEAAVNKCIAGEITDTTCDKWTKALWEEARQFGLTEEVSRILDEISVREMEEAIERLKWMQRRWDEEK
jgi:hypothetical protein